MNLLFYIMMLLSGTCAVGLIALSLLSRSGRATLRRAQVILNGAPRPGIEGQKAAAALPLKLLAISSWLRENLGMTVNPKLAERFEQAGIVAPSHRDTYLVARIVGPILGVIAAFFSPLSGAFSFLAFPAVAYLAPDLILTRIIKSRREKIRLGVPDAVDLLVICVDAGLGLDQAMLRVAVELQKRHPSLRQEFLRINREQRAGKQRLDAWQGMADRNRLPEIDGFVNMLQQTERFGTPIARALSEFGDGIRQKRRQQAEELAAKTTVKIIFPLVLCIFPSLFIVLLGPPGIRVSQGLIPQ
jgi:tight adherence protein C